MNQIRKIKVNSSNLRINESLGPVSVDMDKRTVEMVFSTGEKGKRSSFFGSYFEELEISERAIDLTRLNSGAPLLATHDDKSLDSVVGVVERAWVEGDKAKAIVRFAKDEISERVFQKVVDGILRNVSVGYTAEYEDVSKDEDEIPTYRAVRWTPMEVSIVPIGFDKNAQIRNNEQDKETEITITKKVVEKNEENKRMSEENKQKEIQAAIDQEKTRCLEIRKAVKEAGLKEELAEEYISRNVTLDDVRTNVTLFKKYQKENEANAVSPTASITVGTENQEKRRDLIVDAMLHRADSQNFRLDDNSKQFAGRSLLRVMEMHVGRSPFESDTEFVKRVMTTSDLPYILANVAEKTAQKRYELAPKTFEAWTSSGTLRDYKEATQVRAGDIGELKQMTEAGEYEESNIGEEKETAQLEKYGVIHSFSDKMLINDDLNLILSVARESGVAQARLDNKLAYLAITSNPVMADGENLFSTAHANLAGAGAAISETTFNDAFLAMRTQRSVDGRDQLNIAPEFLIVGPQLETSAKKFLATVQPNQTSQVNIFSNSVKLVVDAAITDKSYFFAANPMMVDTVKVNRLAGQEQVRVDSRVNWRNDAVELKLSYAVQAKAMDFRGLYKVPTF